MEVWSVRCCRFCQGFGVQAKPADYEKWRASTSEFARKACAKRKIDDGTLAVRVMRFCNKLTKGRPKCSWCAGIGCWEKREPDEEV